MNIYSEFIQLLGSVIRLLGMLTFGAATGWFTLYAFRQAKDHWQLQTAIFLGFFFFVALAIRFTSASGIGGFGLGAGAAMLFWGLKKDSDSEEEKESENED
jgi:hypothetical protein